MCSAGSDVLSFMHVQAHSHYFISAAVQWFYLAPQNKLQGLKSTSLEMEEITEILQIADIVKILCFLGFFFFFCADRHEFDWYVSYYRIIKVGESY